MEDFDDQTLNRVCSLRWVLDDGMPTRLKDWRCSSLDAEA